MDAQPPRLNRPVAIAAIVAALLIGLLLGGGLGGLTRLFGGEPDTVASSALQSMRAQNRLVPFVARFVSVTSSKQQSLGGLVSSERTLILPGDVRYELDLAKLKDGDVTWDKGSQTLSVTLPEIEIAGPEVDLKNSREYGDNGLLGRITDAERSLDRANRDRAVTDLRNQARADVPMRLAREAGRRAVEQSFVMPLRAAGFSSAKVVARYVTEGDGGPTEYLDRSRSYNEVLGEAAAARR